MIPDFNKHGVLPPFIGGEGDERTKGNLSPYKCCIVKLCTRFGTTEERIHILKKLILFRTKMNDENIIYGFQWLYGSFTENRNPKDLDIITFFKGLTEEKINVIKNSFPEFLSDDKSREEYLLDHNCFAIDISPEFTVDLLADSMQLCTHTRSGVWKGIIRLELNTPFKDEEALKYLKNIKL